MTCLLPLLVGYAKAILNQILLTFQGPPYLGVPVWLGLGQGDTRKFAEDEGWVIGSLSSDKRQVREKSKLSDLFPLFLPCTWFWCYELQKPFYSLKMARTGDKSQQLRMSEWTERNHIAPWAVEPTQPPPPIRFLKWKSKGFPGGAVVESPPANAGDAGSCPGLGRSHMLRSNWARESQLLSLRVWSLCSATREAVIVRGPRTAMKSGPRSPQLEKALAQKRRPNTAKNK